MADQVPKAVVQERYERLIAVQEQVGLDAARELVGTEVEVLVNAAGPQGRRDRAGVRPGPGRPAGARRR